MRNVFFRLPRVITGCRCTTTARLVVLTATIELIYRASADRKMFRGKICTEKNDKRTNRDEMTRDRRLDDLSVSFVYGMFRNHMILIINDITNSVLRFSRETFLNLLVRMTHNLLQCYKILYKFYITFFLSTFFILPGNFN